VSATEHGVRDCNGATDQHLDKVALAQFTFKGDKLRAVGAAIAKAFDYIPTMGFNVTVWSDEVELPELDKADRNLIGTAWKNLVRWKIIVRMEGAGDHRKANRDKRKKRRGGIAFRYQLLDAKLLRSFLKANHVEPAAEPQKELF
jgi:hypothetical protein